MDIEIPLTRQEKYKRKILPKKQKKQKAHDKKIKYEKDYKELGFNIKCCDNVKNTILSDIRYIDLIDIDYPYDRIDKDYFFSYFFRYDSDDD
jgi:hypothetical protein